MNTLHMASLGLAALMCLPSLAMANERQSQNSGFSSTRQFGPPPFNGRFVADHDTCTARGCCPSQSVTDFDSFSSPISRQPAAKPLTRMEKVLIRLEDDIRYETRGLRGQDRLVDDVASLLQLTRNFHQSIERQADLNHLRYAAADLRKSLMQLDADMQHLGRLPDSEETLDEFVRLFAALETDLGLNPSEPIGQLQPLTAPAYIPRENDFPYPGIAPRPALRPGQSPSRVSQTIPKDMEGIALLSPADQVSALAQATCPVTKEKLGSMGKPIRVTVSGRSLWVCCQGCVNAVKSNPREYFRNLQ